MSGTTRGLAHLVVFVVDGDRYAIRSDRVERVIERAPIETLPWLPRTVVGVLRDGDDWLPVIDPVAALNTGRVGRVRPTLMLLRRAGRRYGLVADAAIGRRELRAHRLQDGGSARTVTRFEDLEGAAVLSDDDGLITLLDPDRLFRTEAVEQVEQTRRSWSDAGAASIVSFRAGGAHLGLHVSQVSEVLPWAEPEDLDAKSEVVLGSTVLRDQRVPLLDLARLFRLTTRDAFDEHTRILVVEIEGERYGLVVDEVSDVERVPADAIASAPRFLRRVAGDVVDAVARTDEGLLLLIRLDLLLTLATKPKAKPKRRKRT
ncbi:MAG TPA: chemotaxis protein CheW [Longimicrobiales bacterium]